MFSPEMKKGSTELLILSLLVARPRHGYELGKLIEARSGGRLKFRIPAIYPSLCRLENRKLIRSRWVEKDGERRRCYYRLTPKGRKALRDYRQNWEEFIAAVNQVIGLRHA